MKNKDIEIKSWYWTGSTESETASMSGHGDEDRDPIWDSSFGSDAFVPEKSVVPGQEVYDFGEGSLSRVRDEDIDWDDLWEDDVYMEPENIPLKLLAALDSGDSILDIGMGDGRHADFMSERGFDVVGIDVSKRVLKESDNRNKNFIKINGDIRYYNFGKKFDAFQALSVLEYIPEYSIALNNIYDHLKPKAYGLIHVLEDSIISKNIYQDLKDIGFKIIKSSRLNIGDESFVEFIVEKKELDKIAKVTITTDCSVDYCPVLKNKLLPSDIKYDFYYNDILYRTSSIDSYSKLASNPDKYLSGKILFTCDLAVRPQDKAAGLQVYPRLKNGAGLLFPYNKPTDVVYHMGKVRYPIDILFIGIDGRISKIYKDIKPGSTAVFGASSVVNVLEIGGGLCDRLGISIGNMVDVSLGSQHESPVMMGICDYVDDNKLFIKKSCATSNRMYKFGCYNILEKNIGQNNNIFGAVDFIKSATIKSRKISLFDFRKLFEESFDINIFDKNKKLSINSNDFFKMNLDANNKFYMRKGPNGSYINAGRSMAKLDDSYNVIIRKFLSLRDNKDSKGIFVFSGTKNSRSMKEFLLGLIEDHSGIVSLNLDPGILHVSDSMDSDDIIDIARKKYGTDSVTLFKVTKKIKKSSGVVVPDDIKSDASEALEHFSKSLDYVEDLYSALEKNREEYNKVQGDQSIISSSKGQYNESCKRNKKIIENALIKTLSGIKVMNKIKDISTTMDIVDAIAGSSKMAVDSVQEVFDLVDQIEGIDFSTILDGKTTGSLNLLDDYKESLRRMKNYINQDIMGILVISE